MTYLPDDIWYMICTELWAKAPTGHFHTIQLCLRRKQLAATSIALANLYRDATFYIVNSRHHGLIELSIGDPAPIADGDSDEEIPAHDKFERRKYHVTRLGQEKPTFGRKLSPCKNYVKKWARLWRTIILSSLGQTLYSYSQSIRTFNLKNLGQLLTDFKFGANTRE